MIQTKALRHSWAQIKGEQQPDVLKIISLYFTGMWEKMIWIVYLTLCASVNAWIGCGCGRGGICISYGTEDSPGESARPCWCEMKSKGIFQPQSYRCNSLLSHCNPNPCAVITPLAPDKRYDCLESFGTFFCKCPVYSFFNQTYALGGQRCEYGPYINVIKVNRFSLWYSMAQQRTWKPIIAANHVTKSTRLIVTFEHGRTWDMLITSSCVERTLKQVKARCKYLDGGGEDCVALNKIWAISKEFYACDIRLPFAKSRDVRVEEIKGPFGQYHDVRVIIQYHDVVHLNARYRVFIESGLLRRTCPFNIKFTGCGTSPTTAELIKSLDVHSITITVTFDFLNAGECHIKSKKYEWYLSPLHRYGAPTRIGEGETINFISANYGYTHGVTVVEVGISFLDIIGMPNQFEMAVCYINIIQTPFSIHVTGAGKIYPCNTESISIKTDIVQSNYPLKELKFHWSCDKNLCKYSTTNKKDLYISRISSQCGMSYVIELEVSHPKMEKSFYYRGKIKFSETPDEKFYEIAGVCKPDCSNVNPKLPLTITVSETPDLKNKFEWTLPANINFSECDAATTNVFIIPPNTLELDAVYSIVVHTPNGSKTIDITTLTLTTSLVCQMTPDTGRLLIDRFNMTCNNISDFPPFMYWVSEGPSKDFITITNNRYITNIMITNFKIFVESMDSNGFTAATELVISPDKTNRTDTEVELAKLVDTIPSRIKYLEVLLHTSDYGQMANEIDYIIKIYRDEIPLSEKRLLMDFLSRVRVCLWDECLVKTVGAVTRLISTAISNETLGIDDFILKAGSTVLEMARNLEFGHAGVPDLTAYNALPLLTAVHKAACLVMKFVDPLLFHPFLNEDIRQIHYRKVKAANVYARQAIAELGLLVTRRITHPSPPFKLASGCLPNEFRCSNSCVDIVKRCDRTADCPNEEDEKDCKTVICPVTHFKCNNHYCIPLDLVCNFEDDCGDGSDEVECMHRQCWNPEFRCENGECLRPGFLCDGRRDCKDGSDETNCSADQFVQCGDGTLKHKYYWCDGWPDCPDNHADELLCGDCNGEKEFLCPNGRCISLANVCDSQCDCVSENRSVCADEINCDLHYDSTNGVTVCRVGFALSCSVPSPSHSGGDRCISSDYLCDGVNHCHNGNYLSDEFGCKPPESPVGYYRCFDNRTIPDSLLCDFKPDCLHGDDERNCRVRGSCGPTQFQCNNGQCVEGSARCNVTFDCHDKSDELNCDSFQCPADSFKCSVGGQCVPKRTVCDFFIDCPDGSDETNCSITNCASDEFKCGNGQCVDLSFRCFVSGTNHDGCADGSHLRGCLDFVCAKDQFKCHLGPCLNSSLICNGVIDCRDSWLDEDGCPFSCSVSAPECQCKDVHINCTGLGLKVFPDAEMEITWFHLRGNRLNQTLTNETLSRMDRLLYLDLSNNSIETLQPMMFSNLWRLTALNLQNNFIRVLNNGSFYGLPSVKGLHLQGNNIRIINAFAFYGLSSLSNLDLRRQNLSLVEPDAFVGLRNLVSLDLSHNVMEYLHDGTLRGLPRLHYLDISDNRIQVIDSNVFRPVTILEKLITDEFRFCCLAREVPSCLPPPDEFSSCEDLMSNIVLRVCVWALAIIATVGNILVIACRAHYKHSNQVHSFLITNLALGDLLMGSYLLLIALVDWHYRGVYFIHDSTWRSSQLCSLAGFISTFSSELSVFTLTVITLDRFLVIIFPFRVRRLEMKRTRLLMIFGWIVATCISAVPLLQIDYFKNFYGRSGVCLALHITPDKPNGWEYSVFVFLFLNLVSFTVIAVGYLWMFLVARTTQHAVHKERRTSESAIAWRMSMLVATDAACWVPIIILGIVSLAGFTVPPQVFAWVAVFVLPLNAAVNPVLYTLSTAPFLAPARHGFHHFRRSCKLSLSQDQRRTYTSNTLNPGGCSIELYSMTRRSVRNSLDTSVTEQGVVLSLNPSSKVK